MSATCRQRKVVCASCGNTARQTRSWMLAAPLVCGKCDQPMTPESLADQAFIGMIGQADMSQAAWNAICRENDWPIVLNQGADDPSAAEGTRDRTDAS